MISFLKAHFSLQNKVSGLLSTFFFLGFSIFSTKEKKLLDNTTTKITYMHDYTKCRRRKTKILHMAQHR